MRLYELFEHKPLILTGVPIKESISSVVYHYAPFEAASKILSNDELLGKFGYISVTRSIHGSYHKGNKFIGVIFKLDGDKINKTMAGRAHGTDSFGVDYEYGDSFKKLGDLDDLDWGIVTYIWDLMDKKYGKAWAFNPKVVDQETEDLLVDIPYKLAMRGKANGQLEDRIMTRKITNFSKYVTHTYVYIPKEYDYNNPLTKDGFEELYEPQLEYMDTVIDMLKDRSMPFTVIEKETDLSHVRH